MGFITIRGSIDFRLLLILLIITLQIVEGKKRHFKYGGNWKSLRDQPLGDDYSNWSKSRTSAGTRRSLPDQRTIHTDTREVPENSEIDLSCSVDRHRYPRIRWSRIGQPLPNQAREYENRLLIRNIQLTDAGTYVCTASNDWDTKEVHIRLTVQPENRHRAQTGRFQIGHCRSDQSVCRSGECINRADICDGEVDCKDGSDEQSCGGGGGRLSYFNAGGECEPNEFKCSNGKCMQLMWRCDGDDDCGDNSDEQNCGQRQAGEQCAPWEFKCHSQSQCVPLAFQCDKHNDCFDGSDELGCVAPTVVEPPKREVTVKCGETIILTCRTIGVPVPYVNWRLNWGPVCGPPRCTQTSVNGFGTLTIRNAMESDQGAYTCEAVNVVGRLLVTPDAIVRVEDCGVEPPPRPPPVERLTVRVEPRYQEVDEGTRVTFRAIVEGGSGGPYTYTWTKVGYTHLPHNARPDGDTLILDDVHIENYGTYRVTVTSPYGDSGSAEGELKVRRVGICPYVWIEPDNQWRGQPGENAEFICKAIGEPTPRIYWSRADGRPLDFNTVDHGDGRLTITNVGPHNYGVYICTGENRAGKNTANATVGEGGPLPARQPVTVRIEPSKTIASKRFETVELRCIATGDEPLTIAWTRVDGQPLANNAQDFANGLLRFVGIEKMNAGDYRCTARNPYDQASDIATVLDPVDIRRTPPFVSITPAQIDGRVGDTAELKCNAYGDSRDPPPRTQWSRSGGPIPYGVHDLGDGTLRFPSLQTDQTGTYECVATTDYGRASAQAPVRIRPSGQPPTTPVIYPPYIIAHVGDRVLVRCESRGDPPPAVRFGYNTADTPLRPGITLTDDSTLIIENVQESDEGAYFCTATNPYGRAVSPPATLRIEKPSAGPPTVWIEPTDRWNGRPGEDFEFICKATGDPPPQISWSREDGRSLGRNVQETGGGRLTLTRVTKNDDGRYVCTAYNLAGSATATATVSLEGGPPVSVQVSPPSQSVPDGQPAQFHCTASGYPPPTLTWGFQRERGSLRSGISHEDGRLYIDHVTKQDAGQYVCTATNEYGSQSATGFLQVAKAPLLRVDPSDKWQGTPGKSHEFRCISVDDPEARISWSRADGRPLDSNVRDHGDGRLTVDNYLSTNNGQYICTGTSPSGTSTIPATIESEKTAPPIPEVTPKIQTVPEGDHAEFECKIEGVEQPTLSWGYGAPGAPLKGHVRVEQGGSRLVINRAQLTDEGQYYCTATNPYGSNSAPGSLYVERAQIPPKVTIKPQKEWKGKPGEDFTFECTATGYPEPDIRWERENEADFDSNVEHEEQGRLTFNKARRGNEGKYVCTATNSAGKDSDSVDVEIESKVGAKIWYVGAPAERVIYVPEGQPFELKCVVTGDPEPEIGWSVDMGPSRGDVPEGYKPVEIFKQFVRHDAFSRANEGIYKCNATNEYGTAEDTVRVLVASSAKRQVVILGGTERPTEIGTRLELRCLLTELGQKYDLRWMKKTPGALRPVRHEQPAEGTLVIAEFSRDDAGVYECQAYDGETKAVISSAEVTVSVFGEQDQLTVVEVEGSKIRSLTAGETLELRCSAPAESPNIHSELRWQILDKGGFRPLTKGSTVDGRLSIPNIQLEDAGIYSCVRYLGEERDGANQVTVLVSNTETMASKVHAEIGHSVDLECPLYRLSGVTYKWKRVNQPKLPAIAQVEGRRLLIPTFKNEYAGTYECEGRLNGARARGYVQLVSEGSVRLAAILRPLSPSPYDDQKTYNAYKTDDNSYQANEPYANKKSAVVQATSKPYIELALDVTPDFVFPGQDVMFRCRVDGDSAATIRWERADASLPRTAYTSRNDLKIRKVQKSDVGRYICHASTKIGEMSAHTNLKLGQKVSGNTVRRYYRLRS